MFIQLALGVVLGAVWPYLSHIFTRVAEWMSYGKRCYKSYSAGIRGDEDMPLFGERARTSRLQRSWTSTALSLIVIVVSIGWAVASSFATDIPADSQGLPSSEHCGSWSLKSGTGETAEADDALTRAEKEKRAGEYGRACYGYRSLTSPDKCSFFGTQSVAYDVSSVDCPFRDKSFCAGDGINIARRFTTGLVDASLIGINVARPPKYNRTTICVPLNIDQGFVEEIPPDEFHYDYRYEYHLGSTNSSGYISNYTFRTEGDPFNYRVPSYSMR